MRLKFPVAQRELAWFYCCSLWHHVVWVHFSNNNFKPLPVVKSPQTRSRFGQCSYIDTHTHTLNASLGTALIIVTPLVYIGKAGGFFAAHPANATTAFSLSIVSSLVVFTALFVLRNSFSYRKLNCWKIPLYVYSVLPYPPCPQTRAGVLLRKVFAFLTTSVAGWIFSSGRSFNYVQVNRTE